MGKASLVIGLVLIIAGAIFSLYGLVWFPAGIDGFGFFVSIFIILFETIPMFVIGGLLLRKYFKNRKMDKKFVYKNS